jgi:hypothetical protein
VSSASRGPQSSAPGVLRHGEGEVTGGRFPDFYIVGHPKCGTTALWEMLRRHPAIFMPATKEPSFFTPETRRRPDSLEAYLSLFAPALPHQRTGEASPSYLWSRTAAERIAQARADARIIAILREPASFLRSLHLEFLNIHAETEKSFAKAMALEGRRAEGKSIPRNSTRPMFLPYSQHVRYVEQLQRFHAVFAPEQILVLIYEEYRADNAATVGQVLRFLGVDDSLELAPLKANPSREIRAPRLSAFVRSLYLGRGRVSRLAKNAIKTVTTTRMRKRALAAQRSAQVGTPSSVDEQLMRELRRSFRDDVSALSAYLDRDLVKLWGYDRLD